MRKSEKYYTIQEAAEFLGYSPEAVWKWVKSGRLKADQEYVTGKGWGRNCYKVSHSDLLKEKNSVAKCLWCKKVIKDAKNRRVRKYCCEEHKYLYKKSIGYYTRKK